MSGVNRVILIGNIGKDPDVKTIGENKVANFSLATSEARKDKDGNKVEQTEWHNIVIWGKLAEVAEKWLKKGSQIYLEGKIRTRNYDKDGVKHYVTEIMGDSFTMLGKAKETEATQQADNQDITSDSLPF